MDPTLLAALIGLGVLALGLLGRVLKAWGDTVIAKLEAQRVALQVNDTKTDKAAAAAEGAKVAAEQAANQVDWQQKATAYKAELDMANRKLALVEGLPDCQDCRLKIRDVLAGKPVERRRTELSSREPQV